VIQALSEEKLLGLFLPPGADQKINYAGFSRLLKARNLVPFGIDLQVNNLALFLYLLTGGLSPKDRAAFAKATAAHKAELDLVARLEAESRKLERVLKSPKLNKASQLYLALSKTPGEQMLYLYLNSGHRVVQDRIRNYLQKHILAAQEITDRQVAALGAEPGTPKFKKLKEETILARLDSRPRKPPAPAAEETPAAPPPALKGPPMVSHARGR
jgi:DNA repair protein RadC